MPTHTRETKGTEHKAPRRSPAEAAAQSVRPRDHQSDDDVRAFLRKPRSHDDLAERLGEEFVERLNGGEDDGADRVPEDVGGPFVVSTAQVEFAEGTDESNPESSTREPFPKT